MGPTVPGHAAPHLTTRGPQLYRYESLIRLRGLSHTGQYKWHSTTAPRYEKYAKLQGGTVGKAEKKTGHWTFMTK